MSSGVVCLMSTGELGAFRKFIGNSFGLTVFDASVLNLGGTVVFIHGLFSLLELQPLLKFLQGLLFLRICFIIYYPFCLGEFSFHALPVFAGFFVSFFSLSIFLKGLYTLFGF